MALARQVPLEEEMKKNPELKEDDLQALREWNSKQPHLPKIPDLDLVLFLHSNYYRMEPTKRTIEHYYTIRTHVPEFFSNRDIFAQKELRAAFELAYYIPLKQTTKEGYRMLLCRLVDTDPSHYVYNDTMKAASMIVDVLLRTEGTAPGDILLLDAAGVAMGHTTRISPMGLKKYLTYLQDAMPIRLKGLHILNATPIMDIIVSMMKPFMGKELLEIFHVHRKMDTLANFVPLEALTSDQGGKAGNPGDLYPEAVEFVEQHMDWFKNDEANARVNESLRPGKAKNATDIFGVEGSFKKLEVD